MLETAGPFVPRLRVTIERATRFVAHFPATREVHSADDPHFGWRVHPEDDPVESGDVVVPSYFLGTVGIMTARYANTNTHDASILERIGAAVRENLGDPTREALGFVRHGAALLVRQDDGDALFDDLLCATHDDRKRVAIRASARPRCRKTARMRSRKMARLRALRSVMGRPATDARFVDRAEGFAMHDTL